ncbi:unnamed protein product [Malus baccata var. baccata]
MRKECHPLLNGGRGYAGDDGKYSHGFSSAEMQSLASICEALLPPLYETDKVEQPTTNKTVQSFYKASAAQTPIPDEVDENAENSIWQAIGYHVESDDQGDLKNPSKVQEQERPLQKGIIETMLETDTTLLNSLEQKRLQVIYNSTKNIYNIKRDAVVVGFGCGGGVVAVVLASSGHKVILYEAGGIIVTADGKIILQVGSTVGGGSAINWSDNKIKFCWGREYLSSMDTVCERIGVTENCIEEGFQNQVLRKGCENLGLEVDIVPRNSSEKHYCGSCGYGCKKGEKKGTDSTWLVDAVDHGAMILTGCKAKKFVLETGKSESKRKKKCLEVMTKALSNSITKRLQIKAKVTVSACGALLTPHLILSSGLKNNNIEFKGKNYEGGIITSAHKVVSADSKAKAIIETPTLGLGTFSALCHWESREDIKNRMLKFSRTAHLISIIRDRGSGVVTKGGRVSYEFSTLNRDNMKEGLRQSLSILIAAGAIEVGTHRIDGLRLKYERPQSLVENWTTYSSAHQMRSCRMGIKAKEGVVDENGESWEAEGLFICDGSVLPSAVGVNPIITIQSIAYCLSKKIADSLTNEEFSKV